MSYINRNRARQTGTNRTTQAEISNLLRLSFPGRVNYGRTLTACGLIGGGQLSNLTFPDGMLIDDTHSAVFDREWYAEKGIHVEEPAGAPVITTIERKGNTIIVEDPTSRQEITVPPHIREFVARTRGVPMSGAERNQPCACGSGKKAKHCCGLVRTQ